MTMNSVMRRNHQWKVFMESNPPHNPRGGVQPPTF